MGWLLFALGLAVCVMFFKFGVLVLQARWMREDRAPATARLFLAFIVTIWMGVAIVIIGGVTGLAPVRYLGLSLMSAALVIQIRMARGARRRAREASRGASR